MSDNQAVTRMAQFLAQIAGVQGAAVPTPTTEVEYWLQQIAEHKGGGGQAAPVVLFEMTRDFDEWELQAENPPTAKALYQAVTAANGLAECVLHDRSQNPENYHITCAYQSYFIAVESGDETVYFMGICKNYMYVAVVNDSYVEDSTGAYVYDKTTYTVNQYTLYE